MRIELIAQISARDDMIFRGFMIPVGLLVAGIGLHAIRRRQLHLRKWEDPLTGTPAIVLGSVITLAGFAISIGSLISFLR